MLALAPGVAGPNGFIALEPGNGRTTNQSNGITLLGGQHLLGTGVPNVVAAQQGVFTLPAIGNGTPVITNGAGAGITLASNNEVANLNIIAPGNGIVGTNIANFNIHGVNITGTGAASGFGILLTDTTGFGQITNSSATNMGEDGLTVNQTTGSLALSVTNSSFNANTFDGITLATSNNALLSAQIQGGSTSNNGNNGINLSSSNTSSLSVSISNHTSSNNACCGIDIEAGDSSAITATIANSTFTGNMNEVSSPRLTPTPGWCSRRRETRSPETDRAVSFTRAAATQPRRRSS